MPFVEAADSPGAMAKALGGSQGISNSSQAMSPWAADRMLLLVADD